MDNFCSNAAQIMKTVGYIILAIKILVPLILLITGVITYGTAVISSDEKEIKNANKKLINKLIAAVVVFLLPTILKVVFGIIDGYTELGDSTSECWSCILDPNDCVVNN